MVLLTKKASNGCVFSIITEIAEHIRKDKEDKEDLNLDLAKFLNSRTDEAES